MVVIPPNASSHQNLITHKHVHNESDEDEDFENDEGNNISGFDDEEASQ
jgi:hypothetical protein